MASDKINKLKENIDTIIFDIDWVFTDGNFIYTADGKFAKIYGPHDADGIKLLKKHDIKIQCISADKRWFPITQKRIQEDMWLPLEMVSEWDRMQRLRDHFDLSKCIYMGDGFHDAKIFEEMWYGIAPGNWFYLAKEKADYVTKTPAGSGAVLEAVLHILEVFYDLKY
jgi:YrbI family 3-deoxy-D-manno-octulosonate 8-phosphate phosphatase